jgi:hypothetical protein
VREGFLFRKDEMSTPLLNIYMKSHRSWADERSIVEKRKKIPSRR